MATKRLVIVGGGEHAQVVAEAALSCPEEWTLAGFVDIDPMKRLHNLPDLPHLGWARELTALAASGDCWAVMGIGATRSSDRREQIVERLAGAGVRWGSVVHGRAWISPTASVGEGAVAFAGVVVNAGARLGAHAVANTGSIIEHDVQVGDFAMVSPGAVIGGGTLLGKGCFVGLGAKIRDHVTVGNGAMVGMGAVVVRDVPAGVTVVGLPAR